MSAEAYRAVTRVVRSEKHREGMIFIAGVVYVCVWNAMTEKCMFTDIRLRIAHAHGLQRHTNTHVVKYTLCGMSVCCTYA
jgi:hypothetical protein